MLRNALRQERKGVEMNNPKSVAERIVGAVSVVGVGGLVLVWAYVYNFGLPSHKSIGIVGVALAGLGGGLLLIGHIQSRRDCGHKA